jgi:hypothetical protein
MLAILGMLLTARPSLTLTKAIIENKIVECGLSLEPIDDHRGRYVTEAAVFFARDGTPGVQLLLRTDPRNACVVSWLKENAAISIIQWTTHEP